MFKVGDRVWVKELKQFGKIDKIEKPMLFDNYYINGNEYTQAELHQTAHDMFVALGYEKVSEDSSYIIYNYHNYEDGYITELRIDKEKNKYKLTNFTNNNQAFSARISLQLHQAIHQQLVELGWL